MDAEQNHHRNPAGDVERGLSEERNLLRTLIDNLPDHIYIKDLHGRFITGNTATARFMGAETPEELVGKTDFDFYPRTVAERFYEDEQRIIRTRRPMIGHEEARPDAHGRTYWISTDRMPLVNAEGEVTGTVGIGHDVTARRKAEEALRESEERYRRFSELTQEGIALFENGMLVDANAAFRRIFGLDPDEPLADNLLETLVLPEFREGVSRNNASGREEPCQVMARGRGGREFPLEIEGRDITLDGRNLRVVTIRDITERKKAEEALAYERYLLASLMDSMPDNIYFKDRDSRFIRINRAVARKFGLSDPSEAVGKRDFDYFTEEHAVPAYRDEQEVIRTGEPVINKEEKEVFPDGREYWITTTRMPLRDEEGRTIGTFGISRDITERVRAQKQLLEREEQLRQVQKIEAVGRLAGGIAHDFNNILTAVIGYAEIALMRGDLPAGLEQPITQIKQAAERAAALTEQLLAFSRKQARQPVVLDLNRLVTSLHPILERLIGENIRLHTSLQQGQVLVRVDQGQMEHVIVNLALNARDAMPGGGCLTLQTAVVSLENEGAEGGEPLTPGRYARLSVSDTGCGIDQQTRERIFEPFFTTKEIGRGTGLGLSTVYGIVKQSGGNIRVRSTPGEGTRFTVHLPQARGKAEKAPERAPAGTMQQGGEDILVVEDEESVRNMICVALEKGGYRVHLAENGEQALRILDREGQDIDLVITDMVMPGMSGPQLSAEVLRRNPDAGVLFISGYADRMLPGLRHQDERLKGRLLHKPFTPQHLAAKIRELLDGESGSLHGGRTRPR